MVQSRGQCKVAYNMHHISAEPPRSVYPQSTPTQSAEASTYLEAVSLNSLNPQPQMPAQTKALWSLSCSQIEESRMSKRHRN